MKLLKRKSQFLFLITFIGLVLVGTIVYNNNKTIFSKIVMDNSTFNSNKGPSHYDYEYYYSYDSADKKVDLAFTGVIEKVYPQEKIIIGEWKDITTGNSEPISDIFIVSDIKVDKVIKGNCKAGDIIKVKQIRVLQKYFEVAEKYVFFLASYDDSKMKVPCSPINPEQGSIPIEKGKIKKLNSAQFIKPGVTEEKLVAKMKEKENQLKEKY